MPVKLLVSNAADAREPGEYLFDRERIAIGRASGNHLTLPDAKRVVSKQHAEIRSEAGSYQLVDLGSKNFTYLNGKRLRSGRPYEIQSGDLFEIGDFKVEFVLLAESESERDETVFAADFSNPFDEPAAKLVSALGEIMEAYDREAPRRRADALQEAFRQAKDIKGQKTRAQEDAAREIATHEAVARVCELLLGAGPDGPASGEPEPAPATPRVRSEGEEADRVNGGQGASASPTPGGEPEAAASRKDRLFGLLLRSVAQLIRIPWQFRHEFIGQTIVQASDNAALYEGEAEALRAYLLAPSLPEDEIDERFDFLREAVEKLTMHQVAILNGYKAGVQTGAKRLLSNMNPSAKEKAVRKDHSFYRAFPMFSKGAVLERLRQTYQELQAEDWSVAERRVFRPAFIKAYLARMTAAAEATSESEA